MAGCYNRRMRSHCQSYGRAGPVVAIDGPVASGKSSVGQAAANSLGLRFLDTGIMYRAVTWLVLRQGATPDDAETAGRLAAECTMSVGNHDDGSPAIIMDEHSLHADALYSPEIDRNVSQIAANSSVRRALVDQQRAIARGGGIVMVGRDIGSVVLPDADVKLYIDATPEERARRRWSQQLETMPEADYREVLADTIRRDELDSRRTDSPLTVAPGAIVVNTDGLNFPQSVIAVLAAIRHASDVAGATSRISG